MDKNKWKLLLTGGAVGLVNGFLGGGGGVFAVVAMTMFLGLPQKNAHATALLVIMVQVFQTLGTWLAAQCDKRLRQ